MKRIIYPILLYLWAESNLWLIIVGRMVDNYQPYG